MIYLTHIQHALFMYRYAFPDIPACMRCESDLLPKMRSPPDIILLRVLFVRSVEEFHAGPLINPPERSNIKQIVLTIRTPPNASLYSAHQR